MEGEMLVQGEFDLNSVQMYSDSLKQVLKQTMLSQEVMFRKQVLELHRLYGVQKVLMQNFSFKEFDRFSFLPFTNPARYDPLVKETVFSSISMLEERPSKNNYKLQRKPLDLQLSADQYISLVGVDSEELNLSLNIGTRCRREESVEEIFPYKKSNVISEEVIDLEDSIDGVAENVPSLNLNAPVIKFSEFGNNHSHISNDDFSVKNERFGSYEAGFLDLNEAQHDDSSCHSNDPIATNYSTPSSSPGFKETNWVKEKNSCFNESSIVGQDADLDSMDAGSRNERKETLNIESKSKGTNASEMDVEFEEEPVGPKVNSSQGLENGGDDENRECEAVTELLVSSIESEHDEESSEMKHIIQNAAESLVFMSLVESTLTQDSCSRKESNDIEKHQSEQPQFSSDSFELLVLKQTENNEDENSASSKLIEMTDMENKEFDFKLRRGRRLKDFQKEILPGLSSLSRHEICEDINILEAVLRSREYQKIRAKMGDGHKWFAPMKSKRSRLNNVRRRIVL